MTTSRANMVAWLSNHRARESRPDLLLSASTEPRGLTIEDVKTNKKLNKGCPKWFMDLQEVPKSLDTLWGQFGSMTMEQQLEMLIDDWVSSTDQGMHVTEWLEFTRNRATKEFTIPQVYVNIDYEDITLSVFPKNDWASELMDLYTLNMIYKDVRKMQSDLTALAEHWFDLDNWTENVPAFFEWISDYQESLLHTASDPLRTAEHMAARE
jgi:hypothetical protein